MLTIGNTETGNKNYIKFFKLHLTCIKTYAIFKSVIITDLNDEENAIDFKYRGMPAGYAARFTGISFF